MREHNTADLLVSLFTTALDAYRKAAAQSHAVDAAFYLAQCLLARLRNDEIAAEERTCCFASAWRLATEAAAAYNMLENPAACGSCYELTASVVLERPNQPREANAREAITYLDRAIDAYRNLSDHDKLATCAANALQKMEYLPIPWSVHLAERYDFYLGMAQNGHPERDRTDLVASRKIASANAWAKASVGAQGDELTKEERTWERTAFVERPHCWRWGLLVV
jgi:tetratricopeptide (TPR) repeat protein